MDFFRSVFTEDPDLPTPESTSPPQQPTSDPDPTSPTQSSPTAAEATSGATTFTGWGFGGLVKSLATRSESVIDTYRRDLQEFGSGLRKETLTLKEVASRAVKDLPSSVEISASKAQNALNSIAEIVAQGKESLLASDLDSNSSELVSGGTNFSAQSAGSGRYSRFEAQLRAIQCDPNTYILDPEDADDYKSWKLGFDLGEKGEEIDDLIGGNGPVDGIYKRVVPNDVDHDEFWCRYYYRVHRLQQAESVRANLVKRAISKEDEEEELSWDVYDDDDDDDDEEVETKVKVSASDVPLKGNGSVNEDVGSGVSGSSLKEADEKGELSHVVVEEKTVDVVEPIKEEQKKPDEGVVASEVRAEPEASDSGKDSDVSVVSNQPSPEEEDLGWDEIEDLGSDDEKKVARPGVSSSNRAELRKRLSTAGDDDEDLNWDIEDDDDSINT